MSQFATHRTERFSKNIQDVTHWRQGSLVPPSTTELTELFNVNVATPTKAPFRPRMSDDHRLANILKPTVASASEASIQYRQLIELLGTSAEDPGGDLIETAYQQLAELSKVLAVADRVTVLADPALRLRSFRLIATLAQSEPPVALAAFRAAEPDPATLSSAPEMAIPDAAPPESTINSFDFTTDNAGRVQWCEPHVAPMVCGLELSEFAELSEALRHHQPIRAASVTIPGAPAIAGAWQIDASPDFSPEGGHYLGHIGRFRRHAMAATPDAGSAADRKADHLRQLLHELRNPINAIQGFAEIIQQQLFGPTPHEYRALAAVIAADAARILAGFCELERLARLAGRTMDLVAGETDLAASIAATILRLKPYTDSRANVFQMAAPTAGLGVQLAPIEIERLCWRLLATLAGCASPGEKLMLELRNDGKYALFIMQLPASLAALDDAALLHGLSDTRSQTLAVGMFGTGFALRLAASEARAAGGRLERVGEKLNLYLPMLPSESWLPAKDSCSAEAGQTGVSHYTT